MEVAEVMTREVKTCSVNDMVSAAAKIMWESDCGCVPVVNGERKVVGIITDRDICMAAYTQGLALSLIRVDSAMAQPVISCAPGDDVATVEELMRQNQVHRIPAVSPDGRAVGIVSLSDIAREARAAKTEAAEPEIPTEAIVDTLGEITRPRPHVGAPVVFGPEEGEMEFRPGPPKKHGRWRR